MKKQYNEYRKAKSLNRAVHSENILHGTEHTDMTIIITISLHTLEALTIINKYNHYFSSVVENRGGGVQRQVVVGNNTGLAPLLTIEIDFQHMV